MNISSEDETPLQELLMKIITRITHVYS